MKRTRVAVIGSNCFSASDFIDLLLEDEQYEVLGISRSPEKGPLFLPYLRHGPDHYQFRQLDLNHHLDAIVSELDAFQPQYIVNFAALSEVALSWQHPGDYLRINGLSMALLFDKLKEASYLERYVHISTPEVYGSCGSAIDESAPYDPSTPYASSKAAADLALNAYIKHFGFPGVLVRSTNVYGAHQQLYKIIPRTAIYLRLGRKIQLHGGGTAVKSFIHIRDVSRGERAIMEHGRNGCVYHLSPDRGHSVREIVETTCQLAGHDPSSATECVGERLGQDAAYVLDSTRARSELSWSPQISLEAGIRGVIDWVDQYWEEIREQALEYQHQA